jgi:DNA-binding SARP family transcriptional activator
VNVLLEAFAIQPRGARILLRLYRAAPRYRATSLLLPELSTPSEGNLKVAIHNLKKKVGADVITSAAGAGYRLTPVGQDRLDQLFERLGSRLGVVRAPTSDR